MSEVKIIKAKLTRNNGEDSNNIFGKKKVCAYCRVSTDLEDQRTSYYSQIEYYSNYIKQNFDWTFVGVYADEGITGTQIKKRDRFIKMIEDCKDKKIDLIIAKSISRFARNTVDTLNTVRLLRDIGIDVFFEKENLHTLNLNSEMFLTLYSAFAQAESESTSANVKMGYRAKMKRGEPCGSIAPYGYTWDKLTKKIIINEEQAKVIRKIFKYYIEGNGSTRITNMLIKEKIPSPKGKNKWYPTVIKTILRNEKYAGDLCGQKYYVSSPITHKLLKNRGEKTKYYVSNHHDAIIDRETWNKVQDIYNKRSIKIKDGKEFCEKFSLRYTFSGMLECGNCHSSFTRRVTKYTNKLNQVHTYSYWVCSRKNECDDRISIRESEIETLFIDLFNKLKKDCVSVNVASKLRAIINNNDFKNEEYKIIKKEEKVNEKISKLLDLKLSGEITSDMFKLKNEELMKELNILNQERIEYNNILEKEENKEKQLKQIDKILNSDDMKTFNSEVFKKMVKKVYVGGYESNNEYNSGLITFILNVDTEKTTNFFEENFLSSESNERFY